jgi:hypothetical protein
MTLLHGVQTSLYSVWFGLKALGLFVWIYLVFEQVSE